MRSYIHASPTDQAVPTAFTFSAFRVEFFLFFEKTFSYGLQQFFQGNRHPLILGITNIRAVR